MRLSPVMAAEWLPLCLIGVMNRQPGGCRHDRSHRKDLDLDAPIERVWRAVSDHKEFGAWFKVALEAPFAVGQEARGQITHPGYEHVTWKAKVVAIEPPARFAFTWHPYGIDP
jgi:uncharacterized protein YndB with AHSA1/START domain